MARLAKVLDEAISTGTVTCDEIAERAGIDRSLAYKYWKNKNSGCTLDTLERLMDAVGAHPTDVFGEREREPEWVVSGLKKLLKRAEGKD